MVRKDLLANVELVQNIPIIFIVFYRYWCIFGA